MTTPLSGDKFDLENYRGLDPIPMMLAIRRDLEYKLPPVGKSTHTAWMAGTKWVRTTWRCDKPGCWFVSTPSTDSNLEYIIQWHQGEGEDRCPTPPRRESLPSGLAEIEKLWREIDDVVDCVKAGQLYRNMTTEGMMGYVKGLAFCVVMKDKSLWPDIKAVSAQALKRWKMRKQLIPWEETPTRHANDFNSIGQKGGWKPASPVVAAPVKKAAPVPKLVKLTDEQVSAIKAGSASGMFTPQELASMYKATVAQVREITG